MLTTAANRPAAQAPDDDVLGFFIAFATQHVPITPEAFERCQADAGLTERIGVPRPHTPQLAFEQLANEGRPLATPEPGLNSRYRKAQVSVRTTDDPLTMEVFREVRDTSTPDNTVVESQLLATLVLRTGSRDTHARLDVVRNHRACDLLDPYERTNYVDHLLDSFITTYTTARFSVPGDVVGHAITQLLTRAAAVRLPEPNPIFVPYSQCVVVDTIQRLLAAVPGDHDFVPSEVRDTAAARRLLTRYLSQPFVNECEALAREAEQLLTDNPTPQRITAIQDRLNTLTFRINQHRHFVTEQDANVIDAIGVSLQDGLDTVPRIQRPVLLTA